jgi:hypothetical protein
VSEYYILPGEYVSKNRTTGDIARDMDPNTGAIGAALLKGFAAYMSNKTPDPQSFQPDWVNKWRDAKIREFAHHLRNIAELGKGMT